VKYQERLANELRRIEQDYTSRINVQSSIATNLSRISPICSYAYILCGLSGTGVAASDDFAQNARRYQDEVEQGIYNRFVVKLRSGGFSFYSVDGFDRQKASLPT